MRITGKVFGSRIPIIAVAIGVWVISPVEASPIPQPLPYSTTVSMGTSGISGQNVVSLSGVDHGTLYDQSSNPDLGNYTPIPMSAPGAFIFRLGEFQVAAQPWTNTQYLNTPFTIVLKVADDPPIFFSGHLDGAVSGAGESYLIAGLDTANLDVFPYRYDRDFHRVIEIQTGDFRSNLAGLSWFVPLVTSTAQGGRTSFVATIYPIPEPTSLLAFLAIVACLQLHHRARREVGNGRSHLNGTLGR